MKRLTGFNEKKIEWQKGLYGALNDFQQALQNIGIVKEFAYEQNLIFGTVRYGLQNTKIEIEAVAIDENSCNIILRGKSDDLGNKGAERSMDRVIETANRIKEGTPLEASLVKRRTGMSLKKIIFAVAFFILLLVAIKGGLRGSIEGTYKWQSLGHESSFTLTGNNKIIYESDGMGFGPVHREGTYTVNKEETYIRTVFDDGEAPYQIKLEKGENKWLLKYGMTEYEK